MPMMPGLLLLTWILTHETVRRADPRATPESGRTETVDGMLFVGIRPATHRAA